MIEHKNLQIKAVSPDGTGLARIATLGVIDKDGDVTLPGAFGDQITKLLPTHNWNSVWLGKARVHEKGNEALADIKFNLDIPAARDWHSALKFDLANGDPVSEWSYGYSILKASEGQFQDQRVRFLEQLKVHEVSPVVVGAGVNTQTLSIKRAISPEEREYQRFIEIVQSKTEILSVQQLDQIAQAKKILMQINDRIMIESRGDIPSIKLPAPPWLHEISRKICSELQIVTPTLYLFRPAKSNETHDIALPHCSGLYQLAGIIYIQAGLSKSDTILVLGHELHHHYQCRQGLPCSELEAESFGEMMVRRYG